MTNRTLTLLVLLSVFLLFASIIYRYWDTVEDILAVIPKDIRGELVSGVFLLLAAGFAYEWGLKQHLRQREHELILKRYLTEGIDLISNHVTDAEQAFLHNYTKASDILQQLRVFKNADLSVKFLTVQTYLGMVPVHKLRYLLGDDILATSIQELLIFVNSDAIYLNTRFCQEALKIQQALLDHKGPETLEQFAGELTDAARHILDEQFSIFTQYAFVQTELQRIASILEKETTLTWADLSEFKNRSEIEKDVEMVKKKLAIVQEARHSIRERKPT